MNKKILYKLLLIFALLACTLLITNTKSFAAVTVDNLSRESIAFEVNGLSGTFSDISLLATYKNIAIVEELSSSGGSLSPYIRRFNILFSNADIIGFYASGNYFYVAGFNSDGTLSSEKVGIATNCDVSVNSEVLTLPNPSVTSWVGDGKYCLQASAAGSHLYNFVYSDSNVYSTNTSYELGDTLLFQQPPQVMEQVGTLAPIVEEMETKKTLAEVVGILPVVLVVIVGLLAMRKAIAFLMRTLKQV